MRSYRTTYLKSDHWRTKRIETIVARGHRCELCGTRKNGLDVHHLSYKRLFNESVSDLRVLCRDCHKNVHALMAKYPKLKKQHNAKQWYIIWTHFRKDKPPKSKQHSINKFSLCRDVLVGMKLVKRERMPWSDQLLKEKVRYRVPTMALAQYIKITGIDPRYHQDRFGPGKRIEFSHN